MNIPTIYLITGANRGIGKGLVQRLLQQSSATIIAAVRNPSDSISKSLEDLPRSRDTKLIIVKIDASVPTDAKDAVASLHQQGITSIDVVFANAGIYEGVHSVLQTPIDDTAHHFKVNVLGPLALLQATADLLKASPTGEPTFIATSSELGSIGLADVMLKTNEAASPYGATKAMLNWFIKRVALEEPWLTSYAIHPGLVETDLTSTIENLKELNPISVDTSVNGILEILNRVETKDLNGTFRNYNGSILPW